MPKGVLTLADASLREIIRKYTKEAGVRSLEREVSTIFRKVAKKIAEVETKDVKPISVAVADLHQYLGPYKFTSSLAEIEDEIGMSTGMAWTEAGGDILLSR